jgi:hypothetical protein
MNRKPSGAFTSIRDAAQESGASYEVVRRAVIRLGVDRKDAEGRVMVPTELVKIFKAERLRSGYLHPRGAKIADLIRGATMASQR